MGSDQQFCLRWHNYQSSLLASLPQLLDSDDLTDVTLSAGGHNLKAHRVVLSACSQYFKELFKLLHPTQHPVIVLPGTNFTDLCALVTFMYSGEVNIYQEQLQGLLTMADAMQIRGLAEVNGDPSFPLSREDLDFILNEEVIPDGELSDVDTDDDEPETVEQNILCTSLTTDDPPNLVEMTAPIHRPNLSAVDNSAVIDISGINGSPTQLQQISRDTPSGNEVDRAQSCSLL